MNWFTEKIVFREYITYTYIRYIHPTWILTLYLFYYNMYDMNELSENLIEVLIFCPVRFLDRIKSKLL